MSNTDFENLISGSESSILDFKAEFYKFENDSNLKETAKFVKDVVSFSNTIRVTTSYIIIGIEVDTKGSKKYPGLKQNIDDAILQDKVKDKVFPRPIFKYYPFLYNGTTFGVLEFPVVKYEIPIIVTVKGLHGLVDGVVYFRNGSANTEAKSLEVIKIADWLRSLPDTIKAASFNAIVSAFIKRLAVGEEKLSTVIADVLEFARNQHLQDLKLFCVSQLQGITPGPEEMGENEMKYRIHDVMVSPHQITVNQHYRGKITHATIKSEMEKDKEGFIKHKFLFIQSLVQIEDFLSRPDTGLIYYEQSSKSIFEDSAEGEMIYVYIFKEMWTSVYTNIKQRVIDELIKL